MDQTDWLAGWLGVKSDRGTMRQREIENYKLFCSPVQSSPALGCGGGRVIQSVCGLPRSLQEMVL